MVIVMGLLVVLWFPAFTKVRLDRFGVFIMTFALAQLPIAAFSGNTTITNATYLFLLGNAIKFYKREKNRYREKNQYRELNKALDYNMP